MHDIRAIRADPAAFDAAMGRRGLPPVSGELMAMDADRRAAQTALQEKQARRNALAKEIGQGKRTGADTTALEAEATLLRGDMDGLEKQSRVSTRPFAGYWKACRTFSTVVPMVPTRQPTSC